MGLFGLSELVKIFSLLNFFSFLPIIDCHLFKLINAMVNSLGVYVSLMLFYFPSRQLKFLVLSFKFLYTVVFGI